MLDDATAAIIATDANCATCLFYKTAAKGEDFVGECRRNPPTNYGGEDGAAFAAVKDGDWCGEWTKKP